MQKCPIFPLLATVSYESYGWMFAISFFVFVMLNPPELIGFPYLQRAGLVRTELAKLKKESAS